MKNVEYLLSGIKVVERKGAVVTEVSGVESDSRQVKKDNLFVAVRGASVDGHDFIGQAIAQGAVVVVCEEFPEKSEPQVSYVKVEDSAVAFGLLAAAWYGNPSKELILVGVTGTNGKTTTATGHPGSKGRRPIHTPRKDVSLPCYPSIPIPLPAA